MSARNAALVAGAVVGLAATYSFYGGSTSSTTPSPGSATSTSPSGSKESSSIVSAKKGSTISDIDENNVPSKMRTIEVGPTTVKEQVESEDEAKAVPSPSQKPTGLGKETDAEKSLLVDADAGPETEEPAETKIGVALVLGDPGKCRQPEPAMVQPSFPKF